MSDKHQKPGEHITGDEQHIAYCGIYCKACPAFTSGKCDGCRTNTAKSAVLYKSCQVRPCCAENNFFTCADCTICASIKDCKKFNPLFLKIASRIEGSSRGKAIEMIKTKGRAEFAAYMEERNWVTFKIKDSIFNKRFGKKVNEK